MTLRTILKINEVLRRYLSEYSGYFTVLLAYGLQDLLTQFVQGVYFQYNSTEVANDANLAANLRFLCFLNPFVDLFFTAFIVGIVIAFGAGGLLNAIGDEGMKRLGRSMLIGGIVATIILGLATIVISLWFPGAYITFGAFQPLPPPEPGKQWYPNPSFC